MSVIKLVIEYKADINAKNNNGQTAVDCISDDYSKSDRAAILEMIKQGGGFNKL